MGVRSVETWGGERSFQRRHDGKLPGWIKSCPTDLNTSGSRVLHIQAFKALTFVTISLRLTVDLQDKRRVRP